MKLTLLKFANQHHGNTQTFLRLQCISFLGIDLPNTTEHVRILYIGLEGEKYTPREKNIFLTIHRLANSL